MNPILLTLVSGFIFLVLSIPITIWGIVNTTKIQGYFRRKAIAETARKVAHINVEYMIIQRWAANPSRAIIEMLLSLGVVFMEIALLIVGIVILSSSIAAVILLPSSAQQLFGLDGLSIVTGIVSTGTIILGSAIFARIISMTRDAYRVLYFDDYKENVMAQMKKLGYQGKLLEFDADYHK